MTTIMNIAWFTTLEAARGRLAWLVGGVVVAGCAIAVFAGEVAIAETHAVRSGLLGAWLRLSLVFTIALFVVTSVVGELHDKGVELFLSMAVSRSAYLAGKLAGFAGVAGVAALACGLVLGWFAPLPQAAIWSASLGLELLLVVSMSLLCAFSFSRITTAFCAVIGFYVLARMMAAMQLMVHAPVANSASVTHELVRALVETLAFALPDLDRFTESEWLIHGAGTIADLGFAATQTIIYVTLLCAAALFDLYRKAV